MVGLSGIERNHSASETFSNVLQYRHDESCSVWDQVAFSIVTPSAEHIHADRCGYLAREGSKLPLHGN
jgi:hypothetical protein